MSATVGVGTVAGRYSARRWQKELGREAGQPARLRFRDAMLKQIRQADCPWCGWPSGSGSAEWRQQRADTPEGCRPPGCVDAWHQIAEGVLLRELGRNGRGADFSPDRRYRYELRRRWAYDGLTVGWLMCNPSVAAEDVDDPTIRKVRGFSKLWGFGGAHVWNLSALVATDPKQLELHPDPTGPDNERYLMRAATAPVLVCAWGDVADPTWANETVLRLRQAGAVLAHLGLTRKGAPRHPAREGYATELQQW